jgi:hypothetical protein
LARKIMKEKGVGADGSICLLSAVQPCVAACVQGNRKEKRLELSMRERKCVWVYRYWDDPVFGFCHARIQTWLPLTVQVCLNGRHWLEKQLEQEGVEYFREGNAIRWVSDPVRAQQLLDRQLRTNWSRMLNQLAQRLCPYLVEFLGMDTLGYYWSADETEWASDLLFRNSAELSERYPALLRYATSVFDSRHVLRFLGKSDGQSHRGPLPNEVLSDLRAREEGIRIKHWVNRNSVKMYNKAGNVLRVETTVINTRELKVYRRANDDRSKPMSWQKMRKGVADLHRRAQISQQCNERYLDALAKAQVHETLEQVAADVGQRKKYRKRSYRALNPFADQDVQLLRYICRAEHALNGFRNADLCEELYPQARTSADPEDRKRARSRTTHRIMLLRAHGLVRKVSKSNRYVLTPKGRKIAAALTRILNVEIQALMEMAA